MGPEWLRPFHDGSANCDVGVRLEGKLAAAALNLRRQPGGGNEAPMLTHHMRNRLDPWVFSQSTGELS